MWRDRLTRMVLAILIVLAFALVMLLTGCAGLDSYVLPTPSPTPTPPPSPTPSPTLTPVVGSLVGIVGDVNLRNSQDQAKGWLQAGSVVLALCDGEWCRITAGPLEGLRFWRGCSSDNPDGRSCQKR
jgi:hypothetical protein